MEFVPLYLLGNLLAVLNRRTAMKLGCVLGQLANKILASRMILAQRNIEAAFPGISVDRCQKIIEGCWKNLGLTAAELACTFSFPKQKYLKEVSAQNWESLQKAHAQGQGVLILTGHFGAWELCAQIFPFLGIPVSLVVRRIKNPWVNAWVNRRRSAFGNEIILARNAVRESIQHLKQGKMVILLIDHRVTQGGLQIPFLGRAAYTTALPAILALRYRMPVYFIQTLRLNFFDGQRAQANFIPAPNLDDLSATPEGIARASERFNSVLEDWVRKIPEQWLWIHNRWKQ